jgi:acetyl esterase/lipase
MKKVHILLPVAFCSLLLFLATRVEAGDEEKHAVITLWPEGAPLAKGVADDDVPNLTVYLPRRLPCRAAVVVLPGGGYTILARDHEGRQPAEWLNNLGVAAFALQYRLGPKYHYPAQLLDVQRAVRYVRADASVYGIAIDRIGVWGFSAGGHLASLAGTHFDAGNAASPDPIERVSSRPNFMILVYPVINPLGNASEWSFKQLLGENPAPDLVRSVSTDLQVTPETPPTFLILANDDDGVSPENSILFYLALRHSGVPAEIHIYQAGGHGFGLAPLDLVLGSWTQRLSDWLRQRQLLDRP